MVGIKAKDFDFVDEQDDGPEDLEHGLIKDSVLELATTDFTYNDGDVDESDSTAVGVLRRNAAAASLYEEYQGKPVSRRRIENTWGVDEESVVGDQVEGDTGDSSMSSHLNDGSGGESLDDQSEEEEDNDGESGGDGGDLSESEIEDDDEVDGDDFSVGLSTFLKEDGREPTVGDIGKEPPGFDIFSASAKDVKQDIEKGKAIRNQLSTWEQLLECRIKLQKGLLASNKLYQTEDYRKFRAGLEPDEEAVVTKTHTGLMELMELLLQLQDTMLKTCADYKLMQNESSKEGEEPNRKRTNSEEVEGEEKKPKMRKLEDLRSQMKQHYTESKPYRDITVEKWGDKSRVLAGRLSGSQTSTLLQIQQILCDKERLLKRTQVKRSAYRVLGKEMSSKEMQSDFAEQGKSAACVNEYDTEIFDDDDFYHKLLRDFVERKTSEVTDPTQLGRRWVELQKLRSKMKRKIDVRATKGRRLRFTVHNRLVNFMAPMPYNSGSWTQEAEKQLFKSLFGKAGIASTVTT